MDPIDPTETIKETAKATGEVAKATGKVIDAAREFGGFIAKYVGGPLEQGMGIFEDKLKYRRLEAQLRMMQKAQSLMQEVNPSGFLKPIPLKFAIPLLEAASLEDSESLQDKWVNLLVNAANPSSVIEAERAYIDILERLSPLEAQILDKIYALPFEEMNANGIVTSGLPDSVNIVDPTQSEIPRPNDEVCLALSNLIQLGCLSAEKTWGGGEYFGAAHPTLRGARFVAACRRPQPAQSAQR